MRSRISLLARLFLLACLLYACSGLCGEPDPKNDAAKKVPHGKGETSLVEIKANPEKFVGVKFILCGGIKVADYYNYAYENSKDTHYSLEFAEVGADTATVADSGVHLYVPKKIGAELVELAVKSEKEHHGDWLLVRVRATLSPAAFASDKQWDTMEVLDWQRINKDFTDWQSWALESKRDSEEKAKEEKGAAARKAAEQEKAKIAATKEADEAAKWRGWTDTTTGKKIEAKFGGVISGKVRLVSRDGSAALIPLGDLSDADREWIKNRKR